ncbi:MAG TPA: sulfatase-like hydrolase/transferase, partial [Flavobacteriales bacterium]|nr:sulfatase-like hydrolase/transferase [Flavobacteriales bacterium]
MLFLVSLNYLTAMPSPLMLFAGGGVSAVATVCFFLISGALVQFSLLLFPVWLFTAGLALLGLKKIAKILAIILYAFIVYCILLDTFIYQMFHFHGFGVFITVLRAGDVWQVLLLSWKEVFLAIILLLFLFLVEGLLFWRVARYSQEHLKAWPLWQVLVSWAAAFALNYIYLIYATIVDEPSLRGNALTYQIINEAKVIPFLDNFYSLLLPKSVGIYNLQTAGNVLIVDPREQAKKLHYPLHPLQCTTPKQPLNIVFIFLDGWRGDLMDSATTPNIARFAKNAWVFNAHSSGGNATGPGTFSFFYSVPYYYWDAMLQQKQGPVFINQLMRAHYQLGIFKSATLKFPALDKTVFVNVPNLRLETPGDWPTQRDERITQDFIQFVQHVKRNQPFFGFLFYDASHTFCEPEHYPAIFQPQVSDCSRIELDKNSPRLPYLNRYKNAVHFDDALAGQALAALQQQNLLRNTIVIVTSDHGNEFNDNGLGYWGHTSDYTTYQLHVPFIVYWPAH